MICHLQPGEVDTVVLFSRVLPWYCSCLKGHLFLVVQGVTVQQVCDDLKKLYAPRSPSADLSVSMSCQPSAEHQIQLSIVGPPARTIIYDEHISIGIEIYIFTNTRKHCFEWLGGHDASPSVVVVIPVAGGERREVHL